ncbi:MAG: DegV family EDD domain-containing protein [Actinomyces sp.]|nr:MAG: DegV family EDD domain-containing protein [Actinomyces sp.]
MVVDSSAQTPPDLARRLGLVVVPIHVTVDGRCWREGVDLDADTFWARVGDGPDFPEITTSQPSPGEFLTTYRDLAGAGAEAVVSVHVGSEHSGTVNAARLAAAEAPVPVEVVDTGTASFGVTLCAWAAVDALAAGHGPAEAARRARAAADGIGTVFVVGALDVVRRSGRLDATLTDAAGDADRAGEVLVFGGTGGDIEVIGAGTTVAELCAVMASAFPTGVASRAAVAVADDASRPLADGLSAALAGREGIVELVHYRVGPSVAAHLGPGTGGGFWLPVDTG